jgi:hypothetical protein
VTAIVRRHSDIAGCCKKCTKCGKVGAGKRLHESGSEFVEKWAKASLKVNGNVCFEQDLGGAFLGGGNRNFYFRGRRHDLRESFPPGLAIALRAARDGANIAIAAKTATPHPKLPGTIHTAAEEIEKAGGRAQLSELLRPSSAQIRRSTRGVELRGG